MTAQFWWRNIRTIDDCRNCIYCEHIELSINQLMFKVLCSKEGYDPPAGKNECIFAVYREFVADEFGNRRKK